MIDLPLLRRLSSAPARRRDEAARWRRGQDLLPPLGHSADRGLAAAIAVLAFLAALAAGAAEIAASTSRAWLASASREATVLVRPAPGRNLEADLAGALALAQAEPGIRDARALSREEAQALLEPWLGRGLDLAELPIPRLIVLTLATDRRPDWSGFSRRLRDVAPSASSDDVAGWTERVSSGARAVVAASLGLTLLTLAASGFAVASATRAAVANNREVIDVLHLMGASEGFIAGEVVRRFARVGLGAGCVGVAAAAVAGLILADGLPGDGLAGSSGSGLRFAAALVAVAAALAAVSAVASWTTVRRVLRQTFRGR